MENGQFYSQEYWQYSSVYNSFVKLFIKDIHALKHVPQYNTGSTRFWLNHPIRWIQVVGIIVALTPRENDPSILLDDSSGATIEVILTRDEDKAKWVNYEDQENQERYWKPPQKSGILDVGTLVKVKGELREKWRVRKLHALKLDIVTDQNIEIKAWEERTEYKRSTLSKPWKLPSSILAKHRRKEVEPVKSGPTSCAIPKKEKPQPVKIDFHQLSYDLHSSRNLKLLILSHLNSLRRFTAGQLLEMEDINYGATCVAIRNLKLRTNSEGEVIVKDRDIVSTLVGALNLLVRDGNLITSASKWNENFDPSRDAQRAFIVVGKWNLGSTIRTIARNEGKVVIKEVWEKVKGWGNGWEGTSKGVIEEIVEQVMTGIEGQEWLESEPGIWTTLDDVAY